MTRPRRFGALAVVALCATRPIVVQAQGAHSAPAHGTQSPGAPAQGAEGCRCPTPRTARPFAPPRGDVAGDDSRRKRSFPYPILAPLGIASFLLGRPSAVAPSQPGGAPPADGSTTASGAEMAAVDSLRPTEIGARELPPRETSLAFRAKVDSLTHGMRAPDTATILPALIAAGMALVGAGAVLLRRSGA